MQQDVPLNLETLPEVMRRTKISRSHLYALIQLGTFAAPVKAGTSSRWVASEVSEWIHARMADRKAASVRCFSTRHSSAI